MDQMTRKTQADSWDLNDPARVRNSMPARVGIDDPRLGPASAQVFSGEDVLGPERRALQKAQFAAWVSQAHAEKEAKKAAEKEELTTYARRMAEVVKVADELETAISDLGKQRQADAAATNLRMAAENLEKKKAEREWEQQVCRHDRITCSWQHLVVVVFSVVHHPHRHRYALSSAGQRDHDEHADDGWRRNGAAG